MKILKRCCWNVLGAIVAAWSLATFFPGPASALNVNRVSIKGIAQAYGFLLAQESALSRIEESFPDMAPDVMLARLQFKSSFGDVRGQLAKEIRDAAGDSEFENMKSRLEESDYLKEPIDRGTATSFLNVIKQRAKGEIPSPVLEYMLSSRYQSNPADEYIDGFRQRYESDGAGKALGVRMKLQLPRSWLGYDGERPHILRKWISENGTGLEMINVDVRDANGYSPTRLELERFAKSAEAKEAVPDGGRLIASGTFALEKQVGYWMTFAGPVERGELKWFTRAIMYQLFFRGKAVGIMCQARRESEGAALEAMSRIRPLCALVLNSLVLPQAY